MKLSQKNKYELIPGGGHRSKGNSLPGQRKYYKKKNVGLGLKEKKTLCPSQTHRLPGVLRGV